jgi:hypothetical protein
VTYDDALARQHRAAVRADQEREARRYGLDMAVHYLLIATNFDRAATLLLLDEVRGIIWRETDERRHLYQSSPEYLGY